MGSIREQILTAAAAAVSGSGKPTGLTVERYRLRPLPTSTIAAGAVVIYPIEEKVRRGDGRLGHMAHRHLTVRFEVRRTGDVPDQSLDPVLSWIVQALMQDPTQGKLCHNTQELRVAWLDAEEVEGATIGAAAVDVQFEYVSLAADPDRRSPA